MSIARHWVADHFAMPACRKWKLFPLPCIRCLRRITALPANPRARLQPLRRAAPEPLELWTRRFRTHRPRRQPLWPAQRRQGQVHIHLKALKRCKPSTASCRQRESYRREEEVAHDLWDFVRNNGSVSIGCAGDFRHQHARPWSPSITTPSRLNYYQVEITGLRRLHSVVRRSRSNHSHSLAHDRATA